MAELHPEQKNEKPRSSDWGVVMSEEYAAGADDVEVMAALGLSREDFANYYETNPVFRKLVDKGRIKASAWWRGIARKQIFNKNFNTSVWSFTMKNREGWAEKTDATVNDAPVKQKSSDELRNEIAAKMPGLAKALGVVKREADIVMLPEKKDE